MKRIKHRFFSQRSVLICFLFIVATCTIMFMMMFFSRISREQAAISEISRIYPDARLIYGVTLDWSDQKNRDVWCVPVQDFIANVFGVIYAYPPDYYSMTGDHEINDATIDLLKKLKRMKGLNFSSTKISERVLLRLNEFPMLIEVQLFDVDVSKETLQRLKEQNPELIILR